MDADTSVAFISWQGSISGPYSVTEIRSLLRLGKIHSLYKIQVDKDWVLLRDHLAEIDRISRASSKESSLRIQAPVRVLDDSIHHANILIPKVGPAKCDIVEPTVELTETRSSATECESTSANGIAMASFILSLCFFIPVLNGITQLLSLVFGHLALSQMGSQHVGKSRALASTGLWISYIQIGFLALTMAWLAIMDYSGFSIGYLVMHGHMLGIALTALIGAGLLMLGIKLFTGHLLSFQVCFIGTLLPAAVSTFGLVVIQSLLVVGGSPTSGRVIASIGLLQIIMFTVQMFFWSKLIILAGEEELGIGRAALASLFYSIVFIFIGILYQVLFAALGASHYY